MKKQKNKGITLIALVITIIVLLILAGVAISTLTGDNGIIGKAGEAKNATNKATALEAVELEAIGALDRGGDIEKELSKTNLETNLKATTEDYGDNLIVDYAGYKFLIEQDGNVIFWDGGAFANGQSTYLATAYPYEPTTTDYKNFSSAYLGFSKIFGDAIYEVSSNVGETNTWFGQSLENDTTNIGEVFFARGAYWNTTTHVGLVRII